MEGAPDHPDNLEEGQRKPNYPVKVHYQPHWFPELRSITWKNYQVWSWLTAAKALQCPISAEAEIWHNYLNREQIKLEAAELLGVFKPENFYQELPASTPEIPAVPPHWTEGREHHHLRRISSRVRRPQAQKGTGEGLGQRGDVEVDRKTRLPPTQQKNTANRCATDEALGFHGGYIE